MENGNMFDMYLYKEEKEEKKEEPQVEVVEKKEEENIDINTIINYTEDQFSKLSSLELLKLQCYVSKYVRTSLKETSNDVNSIIKYLEWLSTTSTILSERAGLQLIPPKEQLKQDRIPRCSYKFCQKTSDCTYFYVKGSRKCNAQHYVHNIVYNDIVALIKYINSGKNVMSEIETSINTINFVLIHMYNELFTLDYYRGHNSYKFHDVNNNDNDWKTVAPKHKHYQKRK